MFVHRILPFVDYSDNITMNVLVLNIDVLHKTYRPKSYKTIHLKNRQIEKAPSNKAKSLHSVTNYITLIQRDNIIIECTLRYYKM